jgi:hypothetical protein
MIGLSVDAMDGADAVDGANSVGSAPRASYPGAPQYLPP